MLVVLGVVEQRHAAVLEVVRDGVAVTEVARRYGVTRQTVHRWLRRYANQGLSGLADLSSKPLSCPHQMDPLIEARIVELRRANQFWGPLTIGHQLGREGVDPVPGRSSIYRCLIRHGLIDPQARKRKRSDYVRWERSNPMELWQMDIVGGVMLGDGSKASIVSGLDDYSRFVISAYVVERATARPVCDALTVAMRAHGVPAEILTDNGKVFTNRFGPGTGEVLFDRICRENGIKHICTKPRSPTTTGKVERWHKTLRREFLNGKVFESITDAQAQLDAWVHRYNCERPHQGIGMVPPVQRFDLAQASSRPVIVTDTTIDEPDPEAGPVGRAVTRKVDSRGLVSFAATRYRAGAWLAGQTVEITIDRGLVRIYHHRRLIETHARRHRPANEARSLRHKTAPPPPAPEPPRRPSASAASVTRKVDSSGNVSFAGISYRVGNAYKRRQVQVAVVGDTVEISIGEQLIKTHRARHDRTREHGALANPGGRPNRTNAA